jgi:hypothetical protein
MSLIHTATLTAGVFDAVAVPTFGSANPTRGRGQARNRGGVYARCSRHGNCSAPIGAERVTRPSSQGWAAIRIRRVVDDVPIDHVVWRPAAEVELTKKMEALLPGELVVFEVICTVNDRG